MAKIFWGNSSNVPKKISTMFIGNNKGIPRLIKKIYIGDSNNQPKLCYEDSSGLKSITYNLASNIRAWSDNLVYVNPNSISSTTPLTLKFTVENYSDDIPPHITIQGGDAKFTKSVTMSDSNGILTVTITNVNPTQNIDIKMTQSRYIPAGCYVLTPQVNSNGGFTTLLNDEFIGAQVLTRDSTGSYVFYAVDGITTDSEGLKYNLRNHSSDYEFCGYSTYTSVHNGYNDLWGYWQDENTWGYSDIELNTLMFETDTDISDPMYNFLFNSGEVLFQPAIHWGVYTWNNPFITGYGEYNLWYQAKPDDMFQQSYNPGMLMTKMSFGDTGSLHYVNEEPGWNYEAMTNASGVDDVLIPFTQIISEDFKEFLSNNLTIYANYTGNTTSADINSFEAIKVSSATDYRLHMYFDPFNLSSQITVEANDYNPGQPISFGSLRFESVLIEAEDIYTNGNNINGYFGFQSDETTYFQQANVSFDGSEAINWRWGNIFIPSIFSSSSPNLTLFLD